MDRTWTRLAKNLYRREPISSFVLTVGAVDAVIGGVGNQVSLLWVGLATIGLAVGLRGLILRRPSPRLGETHLGKTTPIRYLPERSSRPSLPMLGLSERE